MQNILIDPKDLADWRGGKPPVIVDTRSPSEYAEAHIPGAVNVHDIFTYLSSSTPEGLAEMRAHFADVFGKAGIDSDETVVFYEGGMGAGFGQSCRGHFMLAYLGHEDAYVLHGGLQAWRAEGRPVTDIAPRIKPKTFELSESGLDMIVGKDYVLAEIDKDRVTLLDVCDVDEWVGTSSSPYGKDFVPRKGRLPGPNGLNGIA